MKDGLSDNDYHVQCLPKAIRYIRLSIQWITMFRKCIKELDVESMEFVSNNCPVQWNLTYELLKTILDLERDIRVKSITSYDKDFRLTSLYVYVLRHFGNSKFERDIRVCI